MLLVAVVVAVIVVLGVSGIVVETVCVDAVVLVVGCIKVVKDVVVGVPFVGYVWVVVVMLLNAVIENGVDILVFNVSSFVAAALIVVVGVIGTVVDVGFVAFGVESVVFALVVVVDAVVVVEKSVPLYGVHMDWVE